MDRDVCTMLRLFPVSRYLKPTGLDVEKADDDKNDSSFSAFKRSLEAS